MKLSDEELENLLGPVFVIELCSQSSSERGQPFLTFQNPEQGWTRARQKPMATDGATTGFPEIYIVVGVFGKILWEMLEKARTSCSLLWEHSHRHPRTKACPRFGVGKVKLDFDIRGCKMTSFKRSSAISNAMLAAGLFHGVCGFGEPLTPRQISPTGVYQMQSGGHLYVAPMVDEGGPTLQFALSSSHSEGRAKMQPDGSYADDAACQTRFVFTDRKALIQTCSGQIVAFQEFVIRRTPFQFRASDGVTIAASLWTRQGLDLHTGVVLAHGADDESQEMGTIVPMLVSRGLSVATFDQRGVGGSGGAWRPDGIVQISNDVAQIARLMQSDYGMTSVGFFGFSNGGWVAPSAAARFASPAFVIIKSGDSESVEQNIRFQQVTAISRRFGSTAGDNASLLLDQVFKALKSDRDDDWAQTKKLLKKDEGEPWIHMMPLPPSQALPLPTAAKAGFRHQVLFDPEEDILKLHCPILVLLGTDDLDVNTLVSGKKYEFLAESSGNSRLTVKHFIGAGHQLAMGPSEAANNSLVTGRYAVGFPEIMFDWIDQNAKTAFSR